MGIKEQIDADLKQAMLSGNKTLVTTLRGLKSVILYAEVAKGSRDEGLGETELIELLSKETKKRQESADLFASGGNEEKAQVERKEKEVIEEYLPAQLNDLELAEVVDEVVGSLDASGPQAIGQAIGAVKQRLGGQADGGRIAAAVKKRLSQ